MSLRTYINIVNEAYNDHNNKLLNYLISHTKTKKTRDINDPASKQLKLISPNLLPPTTWLIHFSNHYLDIAKNGFKYGESNIDELGFTVGTQKLGVGYNFAFLAENPYDWMKYYVNSRDGAVLFQSTGVYTKQLRDNVKQAIFWGGNIQPKNMLIVKRNNGKWQAREGEYRGGNWTIENTHGEVLHTIKSLVREIPSILLHNDHNWAAKLQ